MQKCPDQRTVASLLQLIADYLEIEGANSFRVAAYRKAARAVEELDRPLAELPALEVLPGVGRGTADVIREIMQTGSSRLLEELRGKIPRDLLIMLRIPGLGPKSVGRLYRELGIDSVDKLLAAAQRQEIRGLPGFGSKKEQKIIEGIERLRARPERVPLAVAWPLAREIERYLRAHPRVAKASVAGSLRRMRETVKDLDFIVATDDPQQVARDLTHLPQVARVINAGATKVTVELECGWPIQADFRLVAPEEFATALHHFTGSQEHNVRMRQRAKKRGMKISEYAVEELQTGEKRHFSDEEELFRFFDLPYISPEIREGKDEIERAEAGTLPALIEAEAIRGDLHMHSTWSDGKNTIAQMAEAARARGYEYIAITDHSKSLRVARGLTEKQWLRQREEIEELNKQWDDFAILTGIELDILPDGALDFPDEWLKEMDLVIGSVHSAFRQDEDTLTKRIIGAIKNEHVDVIAHPTGRLIGRREPYALDMRAVLEAARETGTALELNANPNRLDLSAENLRLAKEEYGVKFAINTDAHSVSELDHMELGIGTARRGWLSADDVINTMTGRELRRYLQRND
ncbi:DNA polymerase/3'-5' exonuclease PolX [Bacillaceae bacterium]